MENEHPLPETEAPIAETPAESAPAPEITEEVPAEIVVAPEDDGPLDLSDDADSVEEVDEEPRKPKSRFQDRIDKLTADKYSAERDAEALRHRIYQMENRERPDTDNMDFEALEKQRFRDVLDEQRKQEAQEEYQNIATAAHDVRQRLFAEKVNAARAEIPNIEEGIRAFAQLPVTPEMAEIIAESDKAAHIAHYMGRNPEKAEQIAYMSPVQQGRAIAQIEAKVTLPSKKVSTAPSPVSKVAAQGAPGVKSPNEMTAAEYLAHWKTTERAKRD